MEIFCRFSWYQVRDSIINKKEFSCPPTPITPLINRVPSGAEKRVSFCHLGLAREFFPPERYIVSECPRADNWRMADRTTAIYVRDTPATESNTQIELALDYATDVLGVEPTEIIVLSDTAQRGRDAQHSGDQKLFDLATGDKLDRIIVRDASRIAMNMRDLHDRIQRFVENDTAVHIIESGLRINDSERSPNEDIDDHALLRAIGIAAELEASVGSERTREGIAEAQAEGKHVGRPPFGFDSDGKGNLIPNENFETAIAVIEEIEAGESKRSVASRAGVTRATVRNIVERKELYLSETSGS